MSELEYLSGPLDEKNKKKRKNKKRKGIHSKNASKGQNAYKKIYKDREDDL